MRPIIFFTFLLLPFIGTGQIITTIAGKGVRGYNGDGGLATAAELNQPIAITVDNEGNVYIVDVGNDNLRKVSIDGTIATLAGKHSVDAAFLDLQNMPYGHIADNENAGQAMLWKPHSIAVDGMGNIFYPEYENGTVRKISTNGIVTTIANQRQRYSYSNGDSALAINAILRHPNGIAVDKSGNIYFAEERYNMVRRISADGHISIVIGTGIRGYTGDGGMATNAELNEPWGVAIDNRGNIFVADRGNQCIRKVNVTGIISTVAGNGVAGYAGDGGLAINASLNEPRGIAVDGFENIYVADSKNNAIRKINAEGVITTFAGKGKVAGQSNRKYSNEHGNRLATSVQLNYPCDVAIDTKGNLYIADCHNHLVRKVTMSLQPKMEVIVLPLVTEKEPLNDHAAKNTLSVKADPLTNLLTVIVDSNIYSYFTITDTRQKVLIEQPIKSSKTEVDVSNLAPGKYFLLLRKDDKITTVSFIRN